MFGHAQGIVRGAQEGRMKATGRQARSEEWSAARLAPALAVRWAPSRACSGFRIAGYRRGYRCRGFYDRYDHFHCYR